MNGIFEIVMGSASRLERAVEEALNAELAFEATPEDQEAPTVIQPGGLFFEPLGK